MTGATSPSPSDLPSQIGPFQILAQLGEGSFGVVYKAERRTPVRQTVALKLLRAGVATKEVLARFELERRALAAMNHRCIAKVFDAGATERGEPWVAMELVEGLPLTAYCDKHKLSLRDRLTLFQAICDGVQHAHQKGVVHRDLKPGNVFVVREGESHVPKILDFGLAKATHRDVFGGGSFATQKDTALGTLEYMSPEQAAGDGEAIDARSDVYSLGVMLYELLCGELPFPSAMLKQAGEMEARRVVVEEEPTKPSTKLLSRHDSEILAAQRRSSLSALQSALSGDLDWLVMKALRKEPEERYGAALAMAADIGRYLAHEPLEAGPPSWGYRAKKFLRKYRVQCVAAMLVVVAILVGGSLFVWKSAEAEEQRSAAVAESEKRKRAEQFMTETRPLADIAYLHDAELRADALWPVVPSRIPDFERWIAQLDPIVGRLPAIEAELASLRLRARPGSEAVRSAAKARASAEIVRLQKEYADLEAGEFEGDEPRSLPSVRKDIVEAEVRLEATGYEFDANADAERHQHLARLVSTIRSFCKEGPMPNRGILVEVRGRLARAQEIARQQLLHRAAWQQAIAAIAESNGVTASTRYGKLAIPEQEGLVPIGMDPESKLWEFVHLPSGTPGKEIPRRDPSTGRLVPDSDMGIVFVLVPGGAYWVGTTGIQPDRPRLLVESLRREQALATGAMQLETPAMPEALRSESSSEMKRFVQRRVAPEREGEPERTVVGEEAIALAVARHCASMSRNDSAALDVLAWALVANGQDAEARQRASEAVANASIEFRRIEHEESRQALHAAIDQRDARLRAAEAAAAVASDVGCPHYDPERLDGESPFQVRLVPYFLSKYEMTQGQWVRVTGNNPSWSADQKNLALPVENVPWFECENAMRMQGLALPTEAQWEVGCRAGTTTPWWTGSDEGELKTKENIGIGNLAVVGSKHPNPFGLCDTHGNLWEWCMDQYYWDQSPREGDGLRSGSDPSERSNRGGHFRAVPRVARAGFRSSDVASDRSGILGLRPARASRL